MDYNVGVLEMASVYRKGRFDPSGGLIGSVPAEMLIGEVGVTNSLCLVIVMSNQW